MESLQRSLLKTIIWRVVATIITFITVYAFTGALNKSTTITLTVAALLAVGYYINERMWDKVVCGRRQPAVATQNESFERVD